MTVKDLNKDDRRRLIKLLKDEKDRIIENMEDTEDPDKIESLEDELNLTNESVDYVAHNRVLTNELVKHIRNILFFETAGIIHEDSNKDLQDYLDIANALEVREDLNNLLKLYDQKVSSS